jgi:hypothetical protein
MLETPIANYVLAICEALANLKISVPVTDGTNTLQTLLAQIKLAEMGMEITMPPQGLPGASGSGGGGTAGNTIQSVYVFADNGPNLSCTTVPATDTTLVAVSIAAGGSNYKQGETVIVIGGTLDLNLNQPASITIASVDLTGQVLAVSISNGGAYTSNPATPQFPSGGSGSGLQVNLVMGPPIPISVVKPHKLSTTLASEKYLGVNYSYSYTQTSAPGFDLPVGYSFIYWTRNVTGSDGTSETDAITPPYLFGDQILVVLIGSTYYDLNADGKAWASY